MPILVISQHTLLLKIMEKVLYLISQPLTGSGLFLQLEMKLQAEKTKKMENPSPPVTHSKLERKPSIDSEPKTLLEQEISLAREAARKIMNTHTNDEALKIFLAGLAPVTSSKPAKEEVVVSDCDEK